MHSKTQPLYYKIQNLEISCPNNFSYKDLDVYAYTKAVFSGDRILDLINHPR